MQSSRGVQMGEAALVELWVKAAVKAKGEGLSFEQLVQERATRVLVERDGQLMEALVDAKRDPRWPYER